MEVRLKAAEAFGAFMDLVHERASAQKYYEAAVRELDGNFERALGVHGLFGGHGASSSGHGGGSAGMGGAMANQVGTAASSVANQVRQRDWIASSKAFVDMALGTTPCFCITWYA